MRRQSHGKKRIILGLTGSFGSGKSTVAGIFRSCGAKIIDADEIAHRLINPRTKIYKKIINTFGKKILKRDITIDRNELAQIVFSDKNLLRKLNKIVHPEVINIIQGRIKKIKNGIIVLDAPLLVEAGLEKMVDKLIVVTITKEKQIKRICKKTGLSRLDILKRIEAQIPLRNKIRLADFIIDNSGPIKKTKKQAERIRRLLWRN